MTNFVLVHGAWRGGWCWRRVARVLRAAGHDVVTPTLTGLGERAHLMTRETNLSAHIQDVLAVLRWEGLSDVVLCGHSYGGMVVSGVADQAPERIRSLVYLDAFVPKDGESVFELLPPERSLELRKLAAECGENWRIPPSSAASLGIASEEDRVWLDTLCVPQPLASFCEPIRLSGRWRSIADLTYIVADGFAPSPFQRYAAELRGDPRWQTASLPCGHDTMVMMPQETAALLLQHT